MTIAHLYQYFFIIIVQKLTRVFLRQDDRKILFRQKYRWLIENLRDIVEKICCTFYKTNELKQANSTVFIQILY